MGNKNEETDEVRDKILKIFSEEELSKIGFHFEDATKDDNGYVKVWGKYYLVNEGKIRGPFTEGGLILALGTWVFKDSERVKQYVNCLDELRCKEYSEIPIGDKELEGCHVLEFCFIGALAYLLFNSAYKILNSVESIWFLRFFVKEHMYYVVSWFAVLTLAIFLLIVRIRKKYFFGRQIVLSTLIILGFTGTLAFLESQDFRRWKERASYFNRIYSDVEGQGRYLFENKDDTEDNHKLQVDRERVRYSAAYANIKYHTNYDIDNIEPVYRDFLKNAGKDMKQFKFVSTVFHYEQGSWMDGDYEFKREEKVEEFQHIIDRDGRYVSAWPRFIRAYMISIGRENVPYYIESVHVPKEDIENAMNLFYGEEKEKYQVNAMMATLMGRESANNLENLTLTYKDKIYLYERMLVASTDKYGIEKYLGDLNYYGAGDIVREYKEFCDSGKIGKTLQILLDDYYYKQENTYGKPFSYDTCWVRPEELMIEYEPKFEADLRRDGFDFESEKIDYNEIFKVCWRYKDELEKK